MSARFRLGLAVVIALTGAGLADRFSASSPPLPAAAEAERPGGVWVCPVVKLAGAGGTLHVVNVGPDPSRIRITFLPDGRPPIEQAYDLGPGRAFSAGTPAAIAKLGAGAIVTFAGGDVTVARTTLLAAPGATGLGSASCGRPGSTALVIPQGSTYRTETLIAMLNPGASDAVVDVSLLVGGQALQPETLRRRVVPAKGRLVVRAGDFVFDERAVGALVSARSGRVVAEAVVLAPRLLDIVPGVAPARELVALGSTDRGGITFAALAVGDQDAVTTGRILSVSGQTGFEPLAAGLVPATPTLGGVPAETLPAGPVALAATSQGAPLAVGARWEIAAGKGVVESAMSAGVPPARRAVVVLGPPATGLRLLLANPDAEEASIDLTVITEAGPASPPELRGVRLAAGRTSTIALAPPKGAATVGVLIVSRGARVAAALEAVVRLAGGVGAIAVTAVPMEEEPVVAVEPDPRQGVPAR